jgi:hypothetical protein
VPDGAVDAVRERFPDAAAVPGGFAVTDPDGVELRVRAEGGVL